MKNNIDSNEIFGMSKDWLFPIIIMATFILGIVAGPLVWGGMLMGLISTIAVWLSIQNLPQSWRDWMGRHPLITDIIFLKLGFTVFALIGSGTMVFVALFTQAVTLALLLKTLHRPDNTNTNRKRNRNGIFHRLFGRRSQQDAGHAHVRA